MPKLPDGGWLLDDSKPIITEEQWAKIQALLAAGKQAEADALIKEIIDAMKA